ncbi:LysE family translocator [Epibacterium sp. SM1979]|uniref:LysE family translocator n=1 Tax=Tritonibacter litoralis TaxID=2662264 RepID=A0A843YGD4_9RHOB|nr:LysE family translocator [Tritonibacter litoralis]MQQ08735.1 LysE family translocator [Tritonibacter litoralis]
MIEWMTLLAFVPAALALNVTPGADMLFCIGQGMRAGPRAAWLASAGVAVGGMIHVTLAGLGLGALVARVPVVFEVIRWLGVAYLLYLAWGALRAQPKAQTDLPTGAALQGAAFRSGLMVNLTNPKVILFVLAFLPQFISVEAGSILGQFLLLGAIISCGGLLVNGSVGMMAGRLGRAFATGSGASVWLERMTGGIFAALAVRLAIMERI